MLALMTLGGFPVELRNRKALSPALLRVDGEVCLVGESEQGHAADGQTCGGTLIALAVPDQVSGFGARIAVLDQSGERMLFRVWNIVPEAIQALSRWVPLPKSVSASGTAPWEPMRCSGNA